MNRKPQFVALSALVSLFSSVIVATTGAASGGSIRNATYYPAGEQLVSLASTAIASGPLSTVGSGFIYQGRLIVGGSPASGNFDFTFTLYDALTGGNQVGSTLTVLTQALSIGTFSVALDFGSSAFQGDARWLQIGVRPSGGPTFTILSPRQVLTPAPYALSLMPGTTISGTVGGAMLTVNNTGYEGLLCSGSGYGVVGEATLYAGVFGVGSNANGVMGQSTNGTGVFGQSANASHPGVGGENDVTNGTGVRGTADTGSGASGVYGTSAAGNGVYGTSSTGFGGRFASTSGTGTYVTGGNGTYSVGSANNGVGLWGVANTGSTAAGVYGTSSSAYGVWGASTSSVGSGVYGTSSTGYGGKFVSTSGTVPAAYMSGSTGTYSEGTANNGIGVWATANTGTGARGVFGASINGTGVEGVSTNGYAMNAGGDTQQERDKGGWAKAMLREGSGAITRCYNSQGLTPNSTPPCGFTITRNAPGDYTIDFGFAVYDRFISITPEYAALQAVIPTMYYTDLNQVRVRTFSGGTTLMDSAFILIIY